MSKINRFNWDEMQKYWRDHSVKYSNFDYEKDPDGLSNVCHVERPLWYNKYKARLQKRVYSKLFSMLPPPNIGARALDVGCGAGRWCRFLKEKGYYTIGIDLQPELLELNRRRYKDIEFVLSSIQDYTATEPFDLISIVTVLQHIPFEEQDKVISKMRKLLKTCGYVIALENTRDQCPHVFSNTAEQYQHKFEKAGFETIAVLRYDYSLCNRGYTWVIQNISNIFKNNKQELNKTDIVIDNLIDQNDSKAILRSSIKLLISFVQRFFIEIDNLLEPILIHSNVGKTIHCGFLFKAI